MSSPNIPEELDASDLGPGWRVIVWRDNDTWTWYSIAENDADHPGSGLDMPVVLAVEQEFKTRHEAINGALKNVRTYLENRS